MEIIGITGGIGMGKSAAGEILRGFAVPVVDTDDLARQVVEPGTPGLAEVVLAFGPGIVDATGRLRRDALAQLVFGDPALRERLNALLHPRIQAAWKICLETWRQRSLARGAVIIPLLFENGYAGEFSPTVCVACTHATQHQRLQQRGWTAAEIDRRIAAQWPVEEKMKRADRVVWTEGALSTHVAQWWKILGLATPLLNPGSTT